MKKKAIAVKMGTLPARQAVATDLVASPGTVSPTSAREEGVGSVAREKGVTAVFGQPYPIGDRTIVADAAYYLDDDQATGRSGRLGSADKIAWRDPDSGYECIIMRKTRDGPLGGYVGVPPSHPLFAFDSDAVPAELEIEVHGGLSYAAICDEGPSPSRHLIREARRVCHVELSPARYAAVEHATDYRAGQDSHEKAWWFGFKCDQVYDALPKSTANSDRFLERETGAVVRDEHYVYDQVVDLAAQLRAIAEGRPKPERTGTATPPLGLDPDKAR